MGEITVLEGDGRRGYQLLFLFAISVPKQIAGANVVPTPSGELPATAAAILTAEEKAALDGGASMFRVVSFDAAEGLTGAQLIARVKEIYAAAQVQQEAWYAAAYKYIGQRISYP